MAATTVKPTLPPDYTTPKIWTSKADPEARTGNQPTAGSRFDKDMPVGEHKLQLYSLGTPNGQKVTILLEELIDAGKLKDYDAWRIQFGNGEQFSSGFVNVNPNSKIPALADHSESPPLHVWESNNILLYLAEKYEAFWPSDRKEVIEARNWLFWQAGGAPFMGGGFGHFYKYAPIHIEYAIDRYSMETKRQLDVLNKHLADKTYVAGEQLTISDIAIFTWVRCLTEFYHAEEFLQLAEYKHVKRWSDALAQRPAFKRGLRVNGFGEDSLWERHSAEDFDKPDAHLEPKKDT
eukprot:scaffold111_cov404-Prasinococcus_capsulatus_cf.AAC.3